MEASRANLSYVNSKKQATMTAESDAMDITDLVNWMDVSEWNQAVLNRSGAGESNDYRGPVEFDIRILCDANEDLTAVNLYGVFEEPRVKASQTVTFTNGTNTVNAAAHGMLTGDGPIRLSNSGGAVPAELAVNTDYWVVNTGAGTLQLSTTQANALQGTVIVFTDDGTGTTDLEGTTEAQSPNPSGRSQRLHYALLGPLNDGGTINVDVQEAYIERARHNPLMKYYVVTATETNTETITIRLDPVYLEER